MLRFSCTALPDGGRMLSYTPVTDLVRHTDDPASAEYYRSLRGGGIARCPAIARRRIAAALLQQHLVLIVSKAGLCHLFCRIFFTRTGIHRWPPDRVDNSDVIGA